MRVGPPSSNDYKRSVDDGESKTPPNPQTQPAALAPRARTDSTQSYGPGTPRRPSVGLVAASARARSIPEQDHKYPADGGDKLINWVAKRKRDEYWNQAYAFSDFLMAQAHAEQAGGGASATNVHPQAQQISMDLTAFEQFHRVCNSELSSIRADIQAARTVGAAHPGGSVDALRAHLDDLATAMEVVRHQIEEKIYDLRSQLLDQDRSAAARFTSLGSAQHPGGMTLDDAFKRLSAAHDTAQRQRAEVIQETRVAQAAPPSHERAMALKNLEARGAPAAHMYSLTQAVLHHASVGAMQPAAIHVENQPPANPSNLTP